ncbi:hypothetical protein CFK37_00185 [Virgibacillus phasianinus]|uniref:Uncharacterized protein n=1 Tax=Virgibacillus phasianinus TaxID=2017483 RepID=A0A220TYA3_9BACI|nr:hypothetical protein [Virgibacillus phasianinus]ASK60735.1 hypothetical protein CFK37_00185 [Virgibacillus phasianinus]
MKKIMISVFFIIVLALIIVPFTNLTLPDPVAVTVTTEAGETEIPVEVGRYCAEGFITGHCTFPDKNKGELSSKAVDVAPGSTITFEFALKPDDFQLIREDANGNEESRRSYMDDEKREIEVPKQSGIHTYSIEGEWGERNRSAHYTFSIRVGDEGGVGGTCPRCP